MLAQKHSHSITRSLTTSLMSQYIQLIPLPAYGTQMLSCWPLYRAQHNNLLNSGHLFRPHSGSKESGIYSTCKNICLNSFAAVLRAEQTMSTLYPLDHRGPYLALFAAAFTVLLLHFSPLATFDALGPSFLSLLCALFFISVVSL